MRGSHDPWRRRWRGNHSWTSPPPDPPGAEGAERIFVGWRTWRVWLANTPRLVSIHDGSVWTPGAPMMARGTGIGAGLYAHAALGNCLAYGAFERDRENGAHVHGRVALWGNVRTRYAEHLADHAYPLTLDVAVGVGPDALEELRGVYGLTA